MTTRCPTGQPNLTYMPFTDAGQLTQKPTHPNALPTHPIPLDNSPKSFGQLTQFLVNSPNFILIFNVFINRDERFSNNFVRSFSIF